MDTETNPGPFQILELVDHTLGFLDAAEDFRACALVSRSWVYPAQSRIFAEIEASPHLVGFISCLTIRNVEVIQLSHLEALSLLPYKRLATLIVFGVRLLEAYLPIQRLLRIPSLTSVTMLCIFLEKEMSFRVWEGCSGNIRHLTHFTHVGGVTGGSSQASAGAHHKRIKLHSLVDPNGSPDFESWFNHPLCPFDVSALKAYKFHRVEDQLPGELSGSRKTVEVAAIAPVLCAINLSVFRRLVQLEISSLGRGSDFDFMSIRTIAPENRAHLEAIRFLFPRYRDTASASSLLNLDRQISGIQDDFPNLKIVEVVVRLPTPTLTKSVDEYFSSLDARISLRWRTSFFNARS
ncbi:hypothetical protein B0H11DRAFT_2228357 [Mycena galericulata]|nr:hypothetical protein B0H11DRAFT_2228357 [Mycena galericulata]